MSKFVIMETVGGFSQPVAIRDTHEIALACCVELAKLAARAPGFQHAHGSVQSLEDGARFSVPEVNFNVVEVENVSVDFG